MIEAINTVKQLRDGYLVNGDTFVPNDERNVDYVLIQKWISNGGAVDPEFTLKDLQDDKISSIRKDYEIANHLDIDYMSTTFQADKASQDIIISTLSAGSVPDDFFWLDLNNARVSMTYSELQGLSVAILGRRQINFIHLQDLKTQINVATTQEELDLIVW